jgi:mannonate dehydratase
MLESWRWFGPDDPVSLENIVQAGAQCVVTSLHHVPTGAAWPAADIDARKREIESRGLQWGVVESIPVHNAIKTANGDYQTYIDNYKLSLQRLGDAGIEVVCYNFMPVVDWTRTNLDYALPNASRALRFEMTDFVAYDVFILERAGATADYTEALLETARQRHAAMSEQEKALLEKNIIAGLPGGEGSYDRAGIREAIEEFIALGEEGLRQNLFSFLEEVIPVAEAAGIRMCIHPDDPPFSLFGLPRVVSTAEDARQILKAVPSLANGLTMCAGSYGARADNDLVAMVREFGPRVHFVHLRNIVREPDGSFYESEHLEGDNDIVGLVNALLAEEARRRNEGRTDAIPMRPDHGHLMGDEIGREGINPGYSFGGRMKGLAELRGVIHALETVRRA